MTPLAHRLIGLGLWLATPQRLKAPFAWGDFVALGRWAVETLNAERDRATVAERHAKPSSRRRVYGE